MADCQKTFGLSVWVTLADAEHGRRIMPRLMGKWYIARGQLLPTDGMIKKTGTKRQPEHHTLWKASDVDISARFEVASPPLANGD
jgi:hypothetical protein